MYEVGPDEFSERWAPTVIGVLRIVTALLFFEHGTAKLLAFPATDMAHPAMWSLPWVAGWFSALLPALRLPAASDPDFCLASHLLLRLR